MPWVKVVKTSEIAEGQIRTFAVGNGSTSLTTRKIAIANVGGKFLAVDDTCTHLHCSLGEGKVLDEEIECPCHGARFDLATGEVRALPATTPIRVYKLKVEGGEILTEI